MLNPLLTALYENQHDARPSLVACVPVDQSFENKHYGHSNRQGLTRGIVNRAFSFDSMVAHFRVAAFEIGESGLDALNDSTVNITHQWGHRNPYLDYISFSPFKGLLNVFVEPEREE